MTWLPIQETWQISSRAHLFEFSLLGLARDTTLLILMHLSTSHALDLACAAAAAATAGLKARHSESGWCVCSALSYGLELQLLLGSPRSHAAHPDKHAQHRPISRRSTDFFWLWRQPGAEVWHLFQPRSAPSETSRMEARCISWVTLDSLF